VTKNLWMLERREQHWNSWKLGTSSQKKMNKFEKDKTMFTVHRWSCGDRTESAGKKLCSTWQFGWVWWTSEINIREGEQSMELDTFTHLILNFWPRKLIPVSPTKVKKQSSGSLRPELQAQGRIAISPMNNEDSLCLISCDYFLLGSSYPIEFKS
jgi:hypothetical protein